MEPIIAVMAGMCAFLLAASLILIGLLSLLPATAAKARSLWPNVTSALITIGGTVSVLLLGGVAVQIFAVLIIFRVNYEAATVSLSRDGGVTRDGRLAASLWAAGAVGIFLGFATISPNFAFGIITAAFFVLWAAGRVCCNPKVKRLLDIAVFPLCPTIVFGTALILPDYSVLAMASYILSETMDSYALVGGKIWGKTKAFPELSPNKTIEGLGVGAAAMVVTAVLGGHFVAGIDLFTVVVVACLAGGLTVIGDLSASAIKRGAGVKDYPVVLRLQGGLLDIFDAWIATFAGLVLIELAYSSVIGA